MRNLVHYSHKPLEDIYDCQQDLDFMGGRKPQGLWVTTENTEDDWMSWCLCENFPLGNFLNKVSLVPKANILYIKTSKALVDFHGQYKVTSSFARRYTGFPKHDAINWPAVAKKYDGIVIAPYQWKHRLSTPVSEWYYSWDVASGCIWKSRAIKKVTTRPLTSDEKTVRRAED